MTGRIAFVGTLLLSAVAGCGRSPSIANPAELAALQSEVARLDTRVAALDASERAATKELAALRREADSHRSAVAELIPTDTTVRWVEAQPALGPFVVFVQYVRSIPDGVRVQLNLGNVTSVAISGAVLKLTYGPPKPEVGDPDYANRFASWQQGLKEHVQSVPGSLRPGVWHPVSVVLKGVNDRAFGYLKVSISTATLWPVLTREHP